MIRPAAVAGKFYPGDAQTLSHTVMTLLSGVPGAESRLDKRAPKAIIAPHAGYVYSGPIAAAVYARLASARQSIRRVVLVGPAHQTAVAGIGVSSAAAFDTPLGSIPLDRDGAALLQAGLPGIVVSDAGHAGEHSLEVQLPFLQMMLDRFTLLPLVVGGAPPELVAAALNAVWGGAETLIVISSDLSHYLDYAAAQALDRRTQTAIECLDAAALSQPQACGRIPIAGLLLVARQRGLTAETVDLRNSGDTAGTRDRVVGYGAWAFHEGGTATAVANGFGAAVVTLARRAIAAALAGAAPPPVPADIAATLAETGACFVTLKRQGQLRGCIGTPIARQPLGVDLLENAVRAATADPRFPPVTAEELPGLSLSVSVLTPCQPMSFRDEADLLGQLRPGIDGLVIGDGPHRALFLPAVWETLPDRRQFLAHLKAKAGLAPFHWSPTFRADRFQAVEYDEAGSRQS